MGKGEKGERQRDNDVVGVSDGVEGVSEKLRGKNAIFCAKQNINELCDRRCCSVQFGMKGEQKRQVFRRQPMARVAIFFCGL